MIDTSNTRKRGCFHINNRNGLILEMDLIIPVHTSFDIHGSINITGFRSLKTTTLFFKTDV